VSLATLVRFHYAVMLQVCVQLVTPYCVTRNVTRLHYAVTLQVCVQLVTPYCVTHLQRYEVMLCGNVTSVCSARNSISCHSLATLRGFVMQ
jgi:hypothetical protein